MKIGVAQIDCAPGDVAANCSKISTYAEQAKQQGCDLVVFPEDLECTWNVQEAIKKHYNFG